jgi:hypothetical protein
MSICRSTSWAALWFSALLGAYKWVYIAFASVVKTRKAILKRGNVITKRGKEITVRKRRHLSVLVIV